MQPQYDSWQKSSHHAQATCVDCHLPHDFLGKWVDKAENGYNHSRAFTLQDFREPIRINAHNRGILQDNCSVMWIWCTNSSAVHDGPGCNRLHSLPPERRTWRNRRPRRAA